MNKVRLTITVDQDVSEKAKELSVKESRSVSQQINKILKEYFEQMATQK